MLSAAENARLTAIGPDTSMGRLLRRYWMPIAGAGELPPGTVLTRRILGENYVLYRDFSGRAGLLDRRCPHRGADLSYGFVEEEGLRCSYHGWCFGADGRCIERPFEEVGGPRPLAREPARLRAAPVIDKAGLLWGYFGPAPAPPLPDWEPFSWPNGFVQIVCAELPCHWLQCQENSIDPVHFEWTHHNWSRRLAGHRGPHTPRHLRVDFEEFPFGFVYRRIREGASESDPLWSVGRVCLWPNAFFLGDHFEWRVPIDERRTLSIAWVFTRLPREREPHRQESIPCWWGPVTDPASGRVITTHVMNQDFAAWIGQGEIADRTRERLGRSDRGVVLLRQRFLRELDALEAGGEGPLLLRDPADNVAIRLPVAHREYLEAGLPLEALRAHPLWGRHLESFVFQAGQPAWVWQAFREAMGLEERS